MGTTVGVLFVVEIKPIHPLDSTTEFSPKKSRHTCVGRDKRWAHQVTSKVLTGKGNGEAVLRNGFTDYLIYTFLKMLKNRRGLSKSARFNQLVVWLPVTFDHPRRFYGTGRTPHAT